MKVWMPSCVIPERLNCESYAGDTIFSVENSLKKDLQTRCRTLAQLAEQFTVIGETTGR